MQEGGLNYPPRVEGPKLGFGLKEVPPLLRFHLCQEETFSLAGSLLPFFWQLSGAED